MEVASAPVAEVSRPTRPLRNVRHGGRTLRRLPQRDAVVARGGHPGKGNLKLLEKGILLEGKQTAPSTITVLGRKRHQTLLKITIHEGRKRQVRKMLEFIGNPVIHLKRIAYGRLFLKDLAIGKYRLLNAKELKKIFL